MKYTTTTGATDYGVDMATATGQLQAGSQAEAERMINAEFMPKSLIEPRHRLEQLKLAETSPGEWAFSVKWRTY